MGAGSSRKAHRCDRELGRSLAQEFVAGIQSGGSTGALAEQRSWSPPACQGVQDTIAKHWCVPNSPPHPGACPFSSDSVHRKRSGRPQAGCLLFLQHTAQYSLRAIPVVSAHIRVGKWGGGQTETTGKARRARPTCPTSRTAANAVCRVRNTPS